MERQANHSSPALSTVLRFSSFRALWLGQICSNLAINTMLFVLALRMYQLTGSNTAVSGLFLAYGIPALLFGLAAGTIVDRLNKRTVLLTCDIARAILIFSLFFFSHNIIFVYVLTFFNAIITQFYVPAEAPTIPRIVSSDYLVTANSLFSFTYFSSLAIGSLLAGPLLRVFGPNSIYLLLSGLFAVAALSVSRLNVPDDIARGFLARISKRSFGYLVDRVLSGLREGVVYMGKSKDLLDALSLLTGTQIILALLGTLGPGFADRILNIDVRDSSLYIVGPTVLGILMGALWVGSTSGKSSERRLIQIGVSAAGIILLLISVVIRLQRAPEFSWVYSQNIIVPTVFVLFLSLGIANSFLDVPANSMLQEKAEGSMRGRVYGMLTALVGGIGILPVVIGGVLADAIGVGRVIFILGLLVTLYGLWRMRYNKYQ